MSELEIGDAVAIKHVDERSRVVVYLVDTDPRKEVYVFARTDQGDLEVRRPIYSVDFEIDRDIFPHPEVTYRLNYFGIVRIPLDPADRIQEPSMPDVDETVEKYWPIVREKEATVD